jgi:hypothetical protein
MTTTWIAAHRSAVINPYETFHLFEPRGFTDQTVRQAVRLAGPGEAFRVRLSNRYGKEPLEIAGAHIARRTEGSGIDTSTDTPLLFAGATNATIPVGEEIVSDAVERAVGAGRSSSSASICPGTRG